jgi:y4mF family transcriptional regulator
MQYIAQMNKELLGIKIRDRRKILKIRQEDLAEISGVALRTIVSVERGEGNPSLETILKIAEVLGMELQMNVKLL